MHKEQVVESLKPLVMLHRKDQKRSEERVKNSATELVSHYEGYWFNDDGQVPRTHCSYPGNEEWDRYFDKIHCNSFKKRYVSLF